MVTNKNNTESDWKLFSEVKPVREKKYFVISTRENSEYWFLDILLFKDGEFQNSEGDILYWDFIKF